MAELPLIWLIVILAGCGVVILVAGTKLSGVCDRLADRTGWGEALTGTIMLGAATSLPGLVTTVTAALEGRGEFALSNAVGGIAVQTAFLAVADMFTRKANLEHRAASLPNILSTAVLVFLLGSLLLAAESPEYAIFSVHPATPFLLAAYIFGIRLVRRARKDPQWQPRMTDETKVDEPDEEEADAPSTTKLFVWFFILAALLGSSGWAVAQSGMALAERTGVGDTVIGGFLTAIITSLPELVTAIAAVRRGALTLAVGDIIGGNAFDIMFAVLADVFYRGGSVYHRMTADTRFMTALGIVLTALMMAGLISREKRGWANIGFESVLVLVLYVGGFLVVALT